MKSKFLRTLIIILAIMAVYYIYNTNAFQREFFPKKHLTKKIEDLKDAVQLDEVMINDTLIELEKIERTKDLEVEREINFAKIEGVDINEARKNAVESVSKEIQYLQEELKSLREELDKDKQLLDQAKQELSKYNK